ncbi:MAG: S41 family peptidase [Patescibacteria group bacterium]|nr:S41 family peptidase [Patescibacteria group bacterium]
MNFPQLRKQDINAEDKRRFFKKALFFVLAIVLAVAIFLAGKDIGQNHNKNSVTGDETQNVELGVVNGKSQKLPDWVKGDIDFEQFWAVWNKIQTEFVDKPVPEKKLFYGALMGLVASLGDPYSIFMEPQESKDFQQELKGSFEGIGAEIAVKNNQLTVVSPLVESPAEKAGLKAGDKILYINDLNTAGLDVNEAVAKIRGPKGTQVTLTIWRDNEPKERKITITRDTIKIVSASWKMEEKTVTKTVQKDGQPVEEKVTEKVAVIKLSNFNEDTNSRLIKVINEILTSDVRGIILDLRGNPGGYIDQAIEVASHWLPAGQTVVSERFADDKKQQHLASGKAELKDYKTVVLINGGSASASEIVAGAFQDHKIATIIGEQSFGKGSVQNLEDYADGSAVKLTVARWLTPNGTTIDKQGITPDIKVELTEDDFNNNKDPQMEKAMELLTK